MIADSIASVELNGGKVLWVLSIGEDDCPLIREYERDDSGNWVHTITYDEPEVNVHG